MDTIRRLLMVLALAIVSVSMMVGCSKDASVTVEMERE
jgi:hypothetical protein